MCCHKKCINKCLVSSSCGGKQTAAAGQGGQGGFGGAARASPAKAHRHSLGDADVAGAFLEQRAPTPASLGHGLGEGDCRDSTLGTLGPHALGPDQPRRASIQPEIVMTSPEEVTHAPPQVC